MHPPGSSGLDNERILGFIMKGDRGPWTPDHPSLAALHTLGPRTCGFSLYLLRLARHLK